VRKETERGMEGKEPVWTREKKRRRQRIREHQKNRGEEGIEFPKDLYANTKNYKGLTVKQNFPLI
jgi:hypothetical protein